MRHRSKEESLKTISAVAVVGVFLMALGVSLFAYGSYDTGCKPAAWLLLTDRNDGVVAVRPTAINSFWTQQPEDHEHDGEPEHAHPGGTRIAASGTGLIVIDTVDDVKKLLCIGE